MLIKSYQKATQKSGNNVTFWSKQGRTFRQSWNFRVHDSPSMCQRLGKSKVKYIWNDIGVKLVKRFQIMPSVIIEKFAFDTSENEPWKGAWNGLRGGRERNSSARCCAAAPLGSARRPRPEVKILRSSFNCKGSNTVFFVCLFFLAHVVERNSDNIKITWLEEWATENSRKTETNDRKCQWDSRLIYIGGILSCHCLVRCLCYHDPKC